MYQIRVEGDFAAAHFLERFHGKCENLHGHNYKVFVYVQGEQLDEGGMLCDFGVVKSKLKEVFKELDHTNLNEHPYFQDGNPSAENIAKFIFESMAEKLAPMAPSRVDVSETEKNWASYWV